MLRLASVPSFALALGLGLALALACERRPKDSADTRATPAKPERAPERAPAPAANTFSAPSEAELAELEAALASHLAAGRAAVEAGDHATGIAELEGAAALNPMHARTLAELGSAHFDAGQLDAARRVLERGLHHAREPDARAAMLDKLGRVAEARGRRELAAELYQRSLSVRPNGALAARLERLSGGVEVLGHSECGWTRHGPAPRRLCPAYLRALEAGSKTPLECAYAPALPGLELEGGEQLFVFSYRDLDASREHFIVSVILDGQWYSSEFAWVSHPELAHADENLDGLELRAEQLSEGGKPEVVIEWEVHGRELDPGAARELDYRHEHLAVLTLEGSAPRWLLGLRTASRSSDRPLGQGQLGPPPVVEAVEIEWTTRTGEFELRATTGAPATALGRFALGTYPILCPAEL